MIRPGDILLVSGSAPISKLIRQATNSKWSHAALVVASRQTPENDGWIIEALARVETRPLVISIHDAESWEIWSLDDLAWDERCGIVDEACAYTAATYNWGDLILQALDAEFDTRWFTRQLFVPGLGPICSFVVSKGYAAIGRDFGIDSDSVTPSDIGNYLSLHSPSARRVCGV